MEKDETQQRQALIEGFINMTDMDMLEENNVPIFGRARPGEYGDKDYVEMDEEYSNAGGEGGHGKLAAGEIKENSNIFKSAFHIFKANVGTGVFMLPTFYKDAGYIVSVILAVLIGTVVVDCTHLLLKTKLKINRRDVTTYSQICNYVCGPIMGWFLFVALCLTQFGFCLMYSQLASESMQEMVDFKGGHYVWVTLMLVLGFPMCCFSDNLSLLAIATFIATIGVFYALISCFVKSCMTLNQLGGGVHPTCNAAGDNIPVGWFNNLANNMMVLEGIAVILPVHASCKQKRLIPRTITIVLTCVITWYLLFGLTGYLAFGTEIKSSLVSMMDMNGWGISIRILFLLNIVFTYPLQYMSAQQLIDQLVGCKPRSWIGLGIRLGINLVIWALAMAMPASAVTVVVNFIGALPSCCMVLIIPSVLSLQVDYAVAHPDEDRMSAHYWKMLATGNGRFFTFARLRAMLYCIIALLIMVIGTFAIIQGLVT